MEPPSSCVCLGVKSAHLLCSTVWLWARSDMYVLVGLRDYTTGEMIASEKLHLTPASMWQSVYFNMTTTKATTCVGIAPGSDPNITCGGLASPAHICVRCGGEFVFGILGLGSLAPGHVELHVGQWGRVGNLPVLASAGQLMQQMGVTMIRQGGSVSQSMSWKRWRGASWKRPIAGTFWGASLIENWGERGDAGMESGEGRARWLRGRARAQARLSWWTTPTRWASSR